MNVRFESKADIVLLPDVYPAVRPRTWGYSVLRSKGGHVAMRVSIVAAFVGLVAPDCYAQIYKWVDENGRTHYSANKNEAGNAKTEALKTEPQPNLPKDPAETSDKHGSPEASNLQKCLAMARQMADQRPTPPEIRARSSEMLALCPNTAYECVSYTEQPETNSCKAVTMRPGGSIVTNKTYKRPSSSTTPPSRAESQTPTLAEQEAAFQRRRIAREQSEGRQNSRAANCASARRTLQQFDGRRVYRSGPNGERIFVEDSERSAIENKARQSMADNC